MDRYVLLCALALALLLPGASQAANQTPPPSKGFVREFDNAPCARPQVFRANHWVQYCPLWRGQVPVYADPDHGNSAAVVGTLVYGGSANWFVGDEPHSRYTYGSYYNRWWAYTLADNGHWGWVPEVYFSGGDNDEPDAGLYLCRLGPNRNECQ